MTSNYLTSSNEPQNNLLMFMDHNDPEEVLSNAREAFSAKDYEYALECYEWFFEHSIQINRGFCGVRITYCVNEWAKLGKKYKKALHRLKAKQDQILIELTSVQSYDLFRDYKHISEALDEEEKYIKLFLQFDAVQPKFAKEIYPLVKNELVRLEYWEICGHYADEIEQHHQIIKQFDQDLEMLDYAKIEIFNKSHECLNNIHEYTLETMREEYILLLTILLNNNRITGYKNLLDLIETDLTKRGYSSLYLQIKESTTSAMAA